MNEIGYKEAGNSLDTTRTPDRQKSKQTLKLANMANKEDQSTTQHSNLVTLLNKLREDQGELRKVLEDKLEKVSKDITETIETKFQELKTELDGKLSVFDERLIRRDGKLGIIKMRFQNVQNKIDILRAKGK